MHILYHHRTAGDRVEAVHILGMVRALRAMGHTVEISSPPGCDPERKKKCGVRSAECGVKRNNDGATSEALAPHEGALRSQLKRFARNAPPWVFEAAEMVYNAYSAFDMLRRSWRRRPDLILERSTANSFAPTWLARCWNAPIVQEVNVTARIGRLRPLAMSRVTRGIERWVARRAPVIVTVSEAFERMLIEEGFPAEKMLVCQNAIEPAEFDPPAVRAAARPAGFPEGAFVVGYVGAFVPWHRVDLLIESARALAPRYPRMRWLLVGDGVERPRIVKLLADAALTEKFWLPGAVTHDMIAGYVKAMDAAVMPHSNLFGSPMKLFEYMAMARPAVMPDLPPIREVITDGVNGMLFRPGDAAALSGALSRLADDEAFGRRLGAQARRDALERHTWPANARRVLNAVTERRKNRSDRSDESDRSDPSGETEA